MVMVCIILANYHLTCPIKVAVWGMEGTHMHDHSVVLINHPVRVV